MFFKFLSKRKSTTVVKSFVSPDMTYPFAVLVALTLLPTFFIICFTCLSTCGFLTSIVITAFLSFIENAFSIFMFSSLSSRYAAIAMSLIFLSDFPLNCGASDFLKSLTYAPAPSEGFNFSWIS